MSSLSNEKVVKQWQLDNTVTDHQRDLFARAIDVSSAACMFVNLFNGIKFNYG